MPLHPDFEKVYKKFKSKYGNEKGKDLFYAWVNKHKYDDTKSMSSQKKQKKENLLDISFKEDGGELYSYGYIATTHIDEEGDMIIKETLDKWAEEINNHSIKVNNVSLHHIRDSEIPAKGIKAEVRKMDDDEYGLWVENHHNKAHPEFEKTKYEMENGFLSAYSIEFLCSDKKLDDDDIRILTPDNSELYGWCLASRPVNSNAIIEGVVMKEHPNVKLVDLRLKEENMMAENVEVKEQPPAVVEQPQATVEVKEEVKVDIAPEVKEETKVQVETKEEPKAELKEEQIVKKIIDSKEFKEAIKNIEVKSEVRITKEEIRMKPEVKEYLDAVQAPEKYSVGEQFKRAGRLVTKEMILKGTSVPAELKEFKFAITDNKLEYKGLGISTNQNTDTDYLLSAAELADVFDPVIYNALNQVAITWNLLAKDDFSGKGNNQCQFTLKIAANTTASAYTGNAVTTGNVTRLKYMTKFKKYQVGVAVDGDMIAAARGGPVGDVFAQEVADSAEDLLSVINAALFAEVGAETAAGVIGFEYITDSAGNTTLYSLTRSTTNKLAPDSASDTYINGNSASVSLANLRKAIRQPLIEGAMLKNLVFITHPIQNDKIKALFDDIQRIPPVSGRLGFEGMLSIDGVPVFVDKDCNSDDIWLVDLETHRVAVWVPPTLEMLGKRSDSMEGFIKTYFAVYNRAPRRMVQIYGNATS